MRYLHTLTLFTLLAFTPPSQANPLVAALGWVGLEATVEALVEETVHKFMNPASNQEDLEVLQQRIFDVEKVLAQNPPKDAPSPEAVAQLQDKAAKTAALFAAVHGRLDKLENRMAALEKHIAALQTASQKTAASSDKKTDSAAPLQLKMSYLYRPSGRGEFLPFKAGDTLHSGDHVKVIFTSGEPLYVYLFNRDQAGKIQRLFPLQAFGKTQLNHQNPVTAGNPQFVPAEQASLVLDKTTGTETLYFMASRTKDTVLESFYQGLESLNNQPQLRETLQAHQIFAKNVLEHKGFEPELAAEAGQISWQEKGEAVQAQVARVKNFCDGCVQVVSYGHQ